MAFFARSSSLSEMPRPVIILGLGYTTKRLARDLQQSGRIVHAAIGHPPSPEGLPHGAVLIHSIPPVEEPDRSAIRECIRAMGPTRVLYISSTGVYGPQTNVDETTIASPDDDKGRARLADEEWLISTGMATGIPALILRSAAIYGPGRGIHMRLRNGGLTGLPRGAGGVVSRIHVDDLAALLAAGIDSDLTGAWPVADDRPAASSEVIGWYATKLGISLPEIPGELSIPQRGRFVDGRKIRELLSVKLKYPSWETGIPASQKEEDEEEAD
jgi:nucleoside-diphosphate-sugar epimerase